MKRSVIRDSVSPDYASLHPGYGSLARTSKPVASDARKLGVAEPDAAPRVLKKGCSGGISDEKDFRDYGGRNRDGSCHHGDRDGKKPPPLPSSWLGGGFAQQ
jgi:hypothetical protein